MITPGRRLSVVGCSGAGKTTLSRQLAQQLGYRDVELDALYHQPGWQTLPTEPFQAQVAEAIRGNGWVVEDNYSAARPLVLEHWDMAIWLDEARPTVTRQVLWNGNRERYANLFSLKPERSILAWS